LVFSVSLDTFECADGRFCKKSHSQRLVFGVYLLLYFRSLRVVERTVFDGREYHRLRGGYHGFIPFRYHDVGFAQEYAGIEKFFG